MVVRAESLKKLRTMSELQSRKEVLEIKGKHLIKESEVLTSAAGISKDNETLKYCISRLKEISAELINLTQEVDVLGKEVVNFDNVDFKNESLNNICKN